MNLCVYTCFVYLQPFCVTLDFKLFIDSIHILFLLYLLLWFWDFTIKNLQGFIKIYRALIKDIFLLTFGLKSYVSNMPFGRRPNPPGFGNGRVAHDLGFNQIARKMTLMCVAQDELLVPSKICWAPKYIPSKYT